MKSEDKPLAGGLWRDNAETPEGKYLVIRRDGTIVEFPTFTLGARDPNSPAALRAYANEAEKNNMDAAYVAAVRRLADEWEEYRKVHGDGDPDRGRHRVDDPETVAKMKKGASV